MEQPNGVLMYRTRRGERLILWGRTALSEIASYKWRSQDMQRCPQWMRMVPRELLLRGVLEIEKRITHLDHFRPPNHHTKQLKIWLGRWQQRIVAALDAFPQRRYVYGETT